MIRSLHQPPDSASVSVCTSTGVGQYVWLLCEQCRRILLCEWESDAGVTEAFYNVSDQESLPSVLWVLTGRPGQEVGTALSANRVQYVLEAG